MSGAEPPGNLHGREIREQETETVTLQQTFVRVADKADAFSELSRCKAARERQFYRVLRQLERPQAARSGEGIPALPSWIREQRVDPRSSPGSTRGALPGRGRRTRRAG